MPRNNHKATFNGSDTGWRFRRPSHQTVVDKDGVDREVGLDAMAISGGTWVDGEFVESAEFEGLELRTETVDETGDTAIIHAATNAGLFLDDVGLLRQRTGYSGQVVYKTSGQPDSGGSCIFALAVGTDPLLTAVVHDDRLEITVVGGAVHTHVPTSRLLDVRLRLSTSFTSWVNGERMDTHAPVELRGYPERVVVGDTANTVSMGRLRYADWHDSARPFSEIEAWPSV